MSSKSRSRDATRQKIVDAAYDLFYEKGFNRVSVDEIAAKSGITKRTLYDHFESKDAMLAVVLDYHAQLAISRIRKYEKRYDGDAPKLLCLLFSELSKWSRKPGWTGSGFSRLSMELADLSGHPARKAAHGHKREVEAWYREMLAVNGGGISGHRGGVKPGQLCCWRLKQKAPFAKGAFCFSAFV
jgi:AcrR family transcriptional regulator